MPTILFYFDLASPIAYVMFHRLPHVLAGLAWQVHYRPVAASMLAAADSAAAPHHDALALAAREGLPFRWPMKRAFQSEPWLRMALASSVHGQPSRQVCESLLNAIWQTGQNPDDPAVQQQAWQAATALLPSVRDWHQPAVAQVLTEEIANIAQAARQQGVLALPSCVLLPASENEDASDEQSGGWAVAQVFSGLQGLPLLSEAVRARQGFALEHDEQQ